MLGQPLNRTSGEIEMTKFLRMTSLVATAAAVALTATPALAVGPNQNSTATARIVKPLTLAWVRDLDLGTIVLSGAGVWAGANVGITRAGVFSCVNAKHDLLGRRRRPRSTRSPAPTTRSSRSMRRTSR